MALNWAMLSPADRAPVPLPHETTISEISTAELTLLIPDAPPSASAPAGGSGGSRSLRESGRLWLTDQRLIFVAPESGAFQSLSVPLPSILSTRFEQPLFGANFLAFELVPAPDGGLARGTRAELRVRDKGMFAFAAVLEKTRERAVYMKRQIALEDEDNLPEYTSPAQAGPSTSIAAGLGTQAPPQVPSDNPPGYDA